MHQDGSHSTDAAGPADNAEPVPETAGDAELDDPLIDDAVELNPPSDNPPDDPAPPGLTPAGLTPPDPAMPDPAILDAAVPDPAVPDATMPDATGLAGPEDDPSGLDNVDDAPTDAATTGASDASDLAGLPTVRPRHLRESWPPTAEIVLDLTDDDRGPAGRDDDEPKVIGRHRKRRRRAPWLAAAASAVAVAGILIAVGALGDSRGAPDAAPTRSSGRPSVVDTAILLPPETPGPSGTATPSPSPSASDSATPTATASVSTSTPTETAPATSEPPTPQPTPTPTPTPTGPKVIAVSPHNMVITGSPGRCVDVNSASWTDGNFVQSWACNGTGAQLWSYTAAGTLRGPGNAVCLAPAGSGSPTSGTVLQVRTCNGSQYQVWQFRSDKSVYNPAAGLCLNDPGAPSANRQLTLTACASGATGQVWTYT